MTSPVATPVTRGEQVADGGRCRGGHRRKLRRRVGSNFGDSNKPAPAAWSNRLLPGQERYARSSAPFTAVLAVHPMFMTTEGSISARVIEEPRMPCSVTP